MASPSARVFKTSREAPAKRATTFGPLATAGRFFTGRAKKDVCKAAVGRGGVAARRPFVAMRLAHWWRIVSRLRHKQQTPGLLPVRAPA
jgi:hypothetical protein